MTSDFQTHHFYQVSRITIKTNDKIFKIQEKTDKLVYKIVANIRLLLRKTKKTVWIGLSMDSPTYATTSIFSNAKMTILSNNVKRNSVKKLTWSDPCLITLRPINRIVQTRS